MHSNYHSKQKALLRLHFIERLSFHSGYAIYHISCMPRIPGLNCYFSGDNCCLEMTHRLCTAEEFNSTLYDFFTK